MSTVVPFRGNKPLPIRHGTELHPLPWSYGNGFIWDANRRVVGSTVEKATAEWVVRQVNAGHGFLTPDADQA